jgi:uncharacterized protein YndB with AHSA1/START domain
MSSDIETMELTITRTIPATPAEVYAAWLDPANPGSVWHGAGELIIEHEVDGLFYLAHRLKNGTLVPHYGRFIVLDPGHRLQHTWVSPFTRGLESTVTVSFEPKGADTLVKLHHANLPDDDGGRGHQGGWNYFLDNFFKKPH